MGQLEVCSLFWSRAMRLCNTRTLLHPFQAICDATRGLSCHVGDLRCHIAIAGLGGYKAVMFEPGSSAEDSDGGGCAHRCGGSLCIVMGWPLLLSVDRRS